MSDKNIIDMHVHVILRGKDEYKKLGRFIPQSLSKTTFKILLYFNRLEKKKELKDKTIINLYDKLIGGCNRINQIVCLALDPVFNRDGEKRAERSNVWISNEYVINLRDNFFPNKVLFGASVHPYDPDFKKRVKECVEKGAVLLKWVPSSQHIYLDDDRVREALVFLATAKNGKPLPLLLHTGMEYAIPTTNAKTQSNDFLCWNFRDKFFNFFRWDEWGVPKLHKIHSNLKCGLNNGAIIIFAHCGLPYFVPKWLGNIFEHSDFKVVKEYLQKYPPGVPGKGCCYADVSAFATPFRRSFYKEIKKLPRQSLLFGSDYPTPAFEMGFGIKHRLRDLKRVLKWNFKPLFVPQDNLLDVNYRALSHFFPEHPMFTNFNNLL
jgi:predicted TIM-barrel fold metal-dependent hydrolase